MSRKRITGREFSRSVILTASALGLPQIARAQQNYPSRPIRFVLPFAAGGVGDITCRPAAGKLGEKPRQRIPIDNQPGPGGISAARPVLSAPPDGYSLGLLSNG